MEKTNQKILEEIIRVDHAGELGAIKLYNEYAHAIIDASVDNVVIATPAHSHYKLAEQAIIHGRDVWIEKPACCSLHELESLRVLAEEHGRTIFVDHTFCYNPAVVKMKAAQVFIGRSQSWITIGSSITRPFK